MGVLRMRYWNKNLKARQHWYKVEIDKTALLLLLADQINWAPIKDTRTYQQLKHEIQQQPGRGRFYISNKYIYFEFAADLTWYLLKIKSPR